MAFKIFRRFNFKDDLLARLQDNIGESLDSLLPVELLNGVRHESFTVGTGDTVLNHLLGRLPRGWIIIAVYGSANSIWETGRNTSSLTLRASASVRVDLWVF